MQWTRQERIQELWRRSDLSYKLKPVQKRLKAAFESCKEFLFTCLVARQTGKTFFWVCVAIELCLRKPKARVRFGTAYQSDLEEFIRPLFERIIEDAPDDVKPKWKAQGSKYVFKNGSECKLVGLDLHPDGIRGNALDLVIIEEAGFVGQLRYVISIIIAMLRHRPELRVVLTSSRPETPDHEYNAYVEKARHNGSLFEATIDDDETCTLETKTRIAMEYGGFDSVGYRRECLNELIVDSELAIIPEWDDKYVGIYEPDEYWQYYHRYNAMDIGGTKEFGDFTANLFATYIFKKDLLYIESEYGIRGADTKTETIAAAMKQKEMTLWSPAGEDRKWDRKLCYKRIADNNNPILLNDLAKGMGRDGKEHALFFNATNKDELGAMINQLRLRVQRGGLLVHPDCKMLLGCLRGGIFNSDKQKKEFARSKVYGHYDWLAALIYLERNLDIHTNPIPRNLGAHWASHQMKDRNPLSNQAKAVSALMGKQFVGGVKRNHG